MRITWVTRSFLDYRIPVFKALDDLCGHELRVIYYKDVIRPNVEKKIKNILGDRAIAYDKELRIGNKPKIDNMSLSNTSFRIPYSPGLVKLVKKTRPEALVSDGFMQWTYAALCVRRKLRIPHVMCYERTKHTERNAGKLRIWYRRFVSRWIDAIDCNGIQTGEYVKELLGWDDSRLTYGHMVADVNGLQESVNSISESQCIDLRKKLNIKGMMLLYVGQIIELKGVRQLLDAFIEFEKKRNHITLVMVGGGPLEEEMKKRIQDSGIKNVVLTGRINYDDIAVYYKAADCFILPTLEDNWSLVVPEAMACGLPVATTIYNGCHPELIHPENGWVFDSLKQESIVDVLTKICDNVERLEQMGQESLKIVSNHTAERAAKSIMEAIKIGQERLQ